MSLFNRQGRGYTYSMKEKIRFAWHFLGMFVVLVGVYLLVSRFANPILLIPTDGVVELDRNTTILFEEKNYCVTDIEYWSYRNGIDLDVKNGACNE